MEKRFFVACALAAASVLFVVSPASQATTVVPPADLGELARGSKSVTFAQAVETWVEEGEAVPYTVTRFHRLQSVSGEETGDVFEVREPGGRGRERAAAVAGAPRFQTGRNYLLFLDPAPDGRWRSKMMAYGLLQEVEGKDLLKPLPEAEAIEVRPGARPGDKATRESVGIYRKDALLQHLREVAKGAPWNRQKAVAEPLLAVAAAPLHDKPAACAFLTPGGDSLPMRWFGFETGATSVKIMATTPGQTGIADGGVSAVQQSLGAWSNHSDSVIRYTYGGTRARNVDCSASLPYDQGAVMFNDPCEELPDLSGSCSGMLAYGGAIYDPAPNHVRTYDGEGWHPILSTFVVVNNGAQCIGDTSFKETVAHEVGHTLGFDHHTPADPADALMSAFLKKDGRGASLAIVDKACAAYAYHTFSDVPFDYWAWRWVEAVENAGVLGVCSGTNFCPETAITRGTMAIALLKAKEGAAYTPPACTTAMFTDVPCSNSLSPWVNELVRRGITAGCGEGKYCPDTAVTRAQMAVFLLATLEGTGWRPPACTTPMFSDMPCSSPFAPWVNELVRRNVTAGCGSGNYCPTTVVNRGQMSVFLSTTFSLPVPAVP